MGLFDIFKKDRGYDIHSLEFCEVGKDGKRETFIPTRVISCRW